MNELWSPVRVRDRWRLSLICRGTWRRWPGRWRSHPWTGGYGSPRAPQTRPWPGHRPVGRVSGWTLNTQGHLVYGAGWTRSFCVYSYTFVVHTFSVKCNRIRYTCIQFPDSGKNRKQKVTKQLIVIICSWIRSATQKRGLKSNKRLKKFYGKNGIRGYFKFYNYLYKSTVDILKSICLVYICKYSIYIVPNIHSQQKYN